MFYVVIETVDPVVADAFKSVYDAFDAAEKIARNRSVINAWVEDENGPIDPATLEEN